MAANPALVKERGISDDAVRKINMFHQELEDCLYETDEYLREVDRGRMFDHFRDIEFTLQRLWGFPEDSRYHTWVPRLRNRFREVDYLGVVYRCKETGFEREVTSGDLIATSHALFGVGKGFIDFGDVVRIVGPIERVK